MIVYEGNENYRRKPDDALDAQQYQIYLEESLAFSRGEVPELRKFIKNCAKR